jgi:hypothetical protein
MPNAAHPEVANESIENKGNGAAEYFRATRDEDWLTRWRDEPSSWRRDLVGSSLTVAGWETFSGASV